MDGAVAVGSRFFEGYWFENGMALRLEVRDRFEGSGVHNLGVRIGVTF